MVRTISSFFITFLVLFILFPLYVAFAMTVPTPLEIKDAAEYRAKGYEFQMRGQLSQAQFFYERARTLTPDDTGLLNDLGLVYEGLGQVEAAEENYLQAISLDYKCLPAYSNLGYFYEAKGDSEMAAQYFEKRVKYGNPLDPRTLEAQLDLDRVRHTSLGMSRKILAQDRQVLENAMVLRAKDKSQSVSREKVISAEVEYQRGLDFFAARQYEAARAAFSAALSQDLKHKGARHMLERARTMAMRGPTIVETAPARNDPAGIAAGEYEKGLRLMRDGYREEALKAFDRGLVFAPADPELLAVRDLVSGKAAEK